MVSKGERDLAEERIATKKSKAYESDASTFSNRLPLKKLQCLIFFQGHSLFSTRDEFVDAFSATGSAIVLFLLFSTSINIQQCTRATDGRQSFKSTCFARATTTICRIPVLLRRAKKTRKVAMMKKSKGEEKRERGGGR